MFKKFLFCIFLGLINSCIPIPVGRFNGIQHYKYRCSKPGDCCEAGKNCEEDLKKEETKQ